MPLPNLPDLNKTHALQTVATTESTSAIMSITFPPYQTINLNMIAQQRTTAATMFKTTDDFFIFFFPGTCRAQHL